MSARVPAGGYNIRLMKNPSVSPEPTPLWKASAVLSRIERRVRPTVVVVHPAEADRNRLAAIAARSGCVVVAECSNGEESLEALERTRPELIVLETVIPRPDGFEILRTMRRKRVQTKAIVVSVSSREVDIREAFHEGALAYIDKRDDLDRWLPFALEQALQDWRALSPAVIDAVFPRADGARHKTRNKGPLTARQEDLLREYVDGQTYTEIGEKFGIATRTVEGHFEAIKKKLRATTKADLFRYAARAGWIK